MDYLFKFSYFIFLVVLLLFYNFKLLFLFNQLLLIMIKFFDFLIFTINLFIIY